MVPCKACEKEIAKGVKRCPNCGKDQRNWFMRHKVMSFFGIIFFFLIIGSLFGGEEEASSDRASKKEETEANIVQVGEPIIEKNVEFTVTNVEQFSVIGDPSFLGKQASEGGTLIGVQYTIKNVSDKPIGTFSQPVVKLVDEHGNTYSSDINASASYAVEVGDNDGKVMSDLNPGITTKSSTAFEISEEAYANGSWYVTIGTERVQIR